jgi:hypothetical protein
VSLQIRAQSTPFKADPSEITKVLKALSDGGYKPLLSEAKRSFIEVVAGQGFTVDQSIENEHQAAFRRGNYFYLRDEGRFPVGGDIFLPKSADGLLYLTVIGTEHQMRISRNRRDIVGEQILEVGIISSHDNFDQFDAFIEAVTTCAITIGLKPAWAPVVTESSKFLALARTEGVQFVPGTEVSGEELRVSTVLEASSAREFAFAVKRAGGMLAADAVKKGGIGAEQLPEIIKSLEQNQLVSQEYVIICKRTSNQVNRVNERSKIDEISKLGILCSCGNPIGSERIEELYVPTPLLKRMLDQSYWMTTQLVQQITELGVPPNKILLNLQEGADEVDAFVDLDGKLIMFELKDNEFSMGHAYPFGGRIGLYKPDFAFIVASKGIAPDVREYFKRVKPESELVYVGNLSELTPNLRRVMDKVRSQKANVVISEFESLAMVNVPLQQLLLARIEKMQMDNAVLGVEDKPVVDLPVNVAH